MEIQSGISMKNPTVDATQTAKPLFWQSCACFPASVLSRQHTNRGLPSSVSTWLTHSGAPGQNWASCPGRDAPRAWLLGQKPTLTGCLTGMFASFWFHNASEFHLELGNVNNCVFIPINTQQVIGFFSSHFILRQTIIRNHRRQAPALDDEHNV